VSAAVPRRALDGASLRPGGAPTPATAAAGARRGAARSPASSAVTAMAASWDQHSARGPRDVLLSSSRPDWASDGAGWPNRDASRFVDAAGLRWHVQVLGDGPALLLLHGTGAATHSWAALAPLLARRFTVIAPDLPGHGFTSMPQWSRMSLPGMAQALAELLAALRLAPALAVGHSAGAAILARMALDGAIAPKGIVSLNGALLPLHGLAGLLFSPAAKLLSFNPLVPRLFAWRAADEAAVRRLIASTGSTLDARSVALYGRLLRSPQHVAGALAMMANWDLQPLRRDLPQLKPPLLLLVAGNDRTVPPAEALRVRALLPAAERVELPALGHLSHEERPDLVAELLHERARRWGVLPNGRRAG
jgi:magnesium chelatase accessory protein